MKLYEFRDFPNPRRVRMLLAEKGVEIPTEQIDVPAGEHRREPYTKMNPYGAVPCLELEDGTFISEAIVISRYLDERFPEPPMLGANPESKARVEMWQRRIEQTLFDPVAAYFHHATAGLGMALENYQNREWGEKNREKAVLAMYGISERLKTNQYIAGNEFSLADITGFMAIEFASMVDIGIPGDCIHLSAWYEKVGQRPSASA